ncbi:MAG: hypothetical protein RBG1_1C00001G0681 [candidate division Zixibacteria bacterium RBG-1]|nr:MAG: hypothetical protein RBG1_1C00001G0681 [candidate division Zixibacteria bacterium RBG-1]OGC85917.1 MAG: hypothetical protein A2V73_08175 [candidate division Zixibacteria bacterium RBG_19FT_COMBO_42_43]
MSNNKDKILRISALIFMIISVGHLLRLIFGLEAVIGGFNIPKYFSILALIIFGLLSYFSFKATR